MCDVESTHNLRQLNQGLIRKKILTEKTYARKIYASLFYKLRSLASFSCVKSRTFALYVQYPLAAPPRNSQGRLENGDARARPNFRDRAHHCLFPSLIFRSCSTSLHQWHGRGGREEDSRCPLLFPVIGSHSFLSFEYFERTKRGETGVRVRECTWRRRRWPLITWTFSRWWKKVRSPFYLFCKLLERIRAFASSSRVCLWLLAAWMKFDCSKLICCSFTALPL